MVLKKGDNNDLVKKVQGKLGVEQVGNFGPKTEVAVKAWQKANGLTDDGIIGPATWKKMFGEDMPSAAPVIEHTVIPPSEFKLHALKGHIPDAVIAQIPDTAAKFNITNPLRLAHFLSQCGHESAGFKAVSENLNYSTDGLNKIFPKYFKNAGRDAAGYARNPEKIANVVYGSRMGNGNTDSGEGWKFRGRGYIQLTGKDNYTAFDKSVDDNILDNPDLVSTKYPLMSAAWFFDKNRLWSICDKGSDEATVTAVTKRVNGGTIGLADRLKHFNEYYNLLK
jgi:putative chitinase